ncbi:lysophospholipid acyltransferase family protein [Sphingomicrobium astaxanthinifaciens]|uniref:lysophospholipid acyltransferase family protein n=1 Tax=Sphingomicrobium astaxanthinifaciens TaxID=1227949 RepID=UPI001FCBDC43|nr:lysophospholipid acyltransferase family protein [Sphingomicrobium astaxanthinifaciens]MCJ7420691.1 1-acyl-sn-glycerol-3-phosphate acyltransferase [Sphingomicrobium astaxanthinifaciens]
MASPSTAKNPATNWPLIGLRLVLLVLLLALLAPLHVVVRGLGGRGPVARWFLRGAGFIMGLRVKRVGPAPPRRSLLLVNHVSWLDILAMGSATGCAFVSKVEVRDHPLTKWLADQRDTLYIERQNRRSVDAQIEAIRRRFDHHLPLALFPEGTTSDGTRLLPFRSPLLKAITPAPPGAHLIPVALDFEEAAAIAWHAGEPGIDNVKRVLSRWRPVRVTVRMLDPIEISDDRKAMAREAQARIADALGFSRTAPSAMAAPS